MVKHIAVKNFTKTKIIFRTDHLNIHSERSTESSDFSPLSGLKLEELELSPSVPTSKEQAVEEISFGENARKSLKLS